MEDSTLGLLGNFSGVGGGIGGRGWTRWGADELGVGAQRRDNHRHRHPEGDPAWITEHLFSTVLSVFPSFYLVCFSCRSRSLTSQQSRGLVVLIIWIIFTS
jgi:hypothetical protein